MQQLDLSKYSELLNKTHGANHVSKKYRAISTQRVIDYFLSHGFTLCGIDVTRALKPENQGFQKHIVSFDAPSDLPMRIDGLKPKLYLLNSHNAKTSLQIFFGVYRMVCSNGLVVGTNYFRERIVHLGDVDANIKTALANSTKTFSRLAEVIHAWQKLELSDAQQKDLAMRLWETRKPKDSKTETSTTRFYLQERDVTNSLRPKRDADQSNDLFTVFNRLQEVLVERPTMRFRQIGFLRVETNNSFLSNSHSSHRNLRQIKGVAKIAANQKLWTAAEKFYSEVV